jgi:hypothetical protein
MTLPPPPDGVDPEALVIIVHGPVSIMVSVTGLSRQEVIAAYQQAGLEIEIVEERRAAS